MFFSFSTVLEWIARTMWMTPATSAALTAAAPPAAPTGCVGWTSSPKRDNGSRRSGNERGQWGWRFEAVLTPFEDRLVFVHFFGG